jgi:hypothetical protein
MVVRTVDSAGQLVTVGAHEVMVEVTVVKMVEVVSWTDEVVTGELVLAVVVELVDEAGELAEVEEAPQPAP